MGPLHSNRLTGITAVCTGRKAAKRRRLDSGGAAAAAAAAAAGAAGAEDDSEDDEDDEGGHQAILGHQHKCLPCCHGRGCQHLAEHEQPAVDYCTCSQIKVAADVDFFCTRNSIDAQTLGGQLLYVVMPTEFGGCAGMLHARQGLKLGELKAALSCCCLLCHHCCR